MTACTKTILGRFNKPSKELMVDVINQTNNRKFTSNQLMFGEPVLMSDDGKSQVVVTFATETGWEATNEKLTYFRSEFSKMKGCERLSIHSDYDDVQGLLDDLFDQYGVLIEAEYIDLAREGEVDEDGTVDYLVTFKNHLIFFGSFYLQVRPSLELLGTTIGQLMDLREYYNNGERDKPFIELYCPRGELLLDSRSVPDPVSLAALEMELYSVLENTLIVGGRMADIFDILTGDDWVCVDSPVPFNLYNAVVLYNGLRSSEHQTRSPKYPYSLVIELSDHYCSNLKGIITVGYMYNVPGRTGELLNDPGVITPIVNLR